MHLVVPLAKRSYSISSPSSHQYVSSGCPFAMDLTVSRATYSSPVMTDQDQRLNGKGVASQFLTSSSIAPAAGIPATIHPSHRFRLPEDRTKPVILIAMGSGIASFKAFYRQNAAENEGRSIHLFYGVKKHTDVVAPRELAAIAKSSPFKYEIATSAEGHKKRITQVIAESYAPFMLEMMNSDACFYICGNTEFIRDVQQAMISIIANSQLDKSPAAVIQAEKFFYRHVAPGRFFTQEFYTNAVADHYPKLPVTQISLHNNTLQGYWVIINNSVYDVTNYLQIHPGGHYLIQLNAGIDATAEFAGVHAHVDSAHALQMAQRYKIGEVEQPVWQDAEIQEAYTKLTTFLSALTAYQNLMAIDYFITGTADYYWLLKALEAHQRFENFVKSTILPGLENLNSILKELNNDFIKPLLLKFRACFDQSFPYERDLFGEVINSKDSDVKITHNVYGFFSKVYQTDAQLLAELKSGIIASTDKLTPSKCLKAKL